MERLPPGYGGLWARRYAPLAPQEDSDDDDGEDSGPAAGDARLRLAEGRDALRRTVGLPGLEKTGDDWNPPQMDESLVEGAFPSANTRVETTGEGRHLVAAKPLPVATVAVQAEAYAWALDASLLSENCAFCFGPLARARSSECRTGCGSQFCSTACRTSPNNLCYLGECGGAQLLDLLPTLPPELILAVRALARLRRDPSPAVLGLRTNLALLPPSDALLLSFSLVHLSHAFALGPRAELLLADLAAAARTNSFAVRLPLPTTDGIAEVRLGSAIFPYLAMADHSCSPNAIAAFRLPAPGRPPAAAFRLLRPAKMGEAVNVSYGPLAPSTPRPERQRLLLRSHMFECRCTACLLPDSSSLPSLDQLRAHDDEAHRLAMRGDFAGAVHAMLPSLRGTFALFGPGPEHAREVAKLAGVVLADPTGAALRAAIDAHGEGLAKTVKGAEGVLKALGYPGDPEGEDWGALRMLGEVLAKMG